MSRFSSFPVQRVENVAEHLFWVAMYSHLISVDLNYRRNTELRKGETTIPFVDHAEVLQKALIHDLPEAKSGDIQRAYKYSIPELKTA